MKAKRSWTALVLVACLALVAVDWYGIDREEETAYAEWQVMCSNAEFAYWYCTKRPKLVSHNLNGGYIEACGVLPGIIGDDC
jgi:hypothetical protein